MAKWLFALACWLAVSAGLLAAGVRYGMTRAELETALGKPGSELHRGSRIVLLYSKGRIDLEGGVVVSVTGLPVEETALQAGESAAPPPEPEAAPSPAHSQAPQEVVIPHAPSAGEDEETDVDPQKALMQATEDLIAAHQKRPELSLVPAPRVFWSGLLTGLSVRMLVTVVVLKLAFKWADVHADWGQMFLPAAADTLTQSGIAAGAYALWRTNQLFHADACASYFVLLAVLMKTTHACNLNRAVAVAGAAKLASLIVWVMVATLLLNLMH